ncbi:hypothetical protein Pla52n_03510 [Stieleria varia]|uniref:Uncharacterized protein n=1 Tax=Stieleria varia TaxID=2528005 RepID=A0A5C6B7J6_9BACT|nr:hypothetical protein Pla52n_03510 [Stieleria varia]
MWTARVAVGILSDSVLVEPHVPQVRAIFKSTSAGFLPTVCHLVRSCRASWRQGLVLSSFGFTFGILSPTGSYRNSVQGTFTPQDHAHVGRTAHEAADRAVCQWRAFLRRLGDGCRYVPRLRAQTLSANVSRMPTIDLIINKGLPRLPFGTSKDDIVAALGRPTRESTIGDTPTHPVSRQILEYADYELLITPELGLISVTADPDSLQITLDTIHVNTLAPEQLAE